MTTSPVRQDERVSVDSLQAFLTPQSMVPFELSEEDVPADFELEDQDRSGSLTSALSTKRSSDYYDQILSGNDSVSRTP